MAWKRLNRRPEIPQGNLVLLGQADDCPVDMMVTFEIITFRGKDREDLLRNKHIQDLTHPGLELFWPVDLIRAQRQDGD